MTRKEKEIRKRKKWEEEEETKREERMNGGMKMCWDRSNFSLVFISSVGGFLGFVRLLLSHLLAEIIERMKRE